MNHARCTISKQLRFHTSTLCPAKSAWLKTFLIGNVPCRRYRKHKKCYNCKTNFRQRDELRNVYHIETTTFLYQHCIQQKVFGLRRGGVVRIEPSRQLLDDCTHKTNSKKESRQPYITEIVFSSAFRKSTFQTDRMKLKKIWPLEDNILVFRQAFSVKRWLKCISSYNC